MRLAVADVKIASRLSAGTGMGPLEIKTALLVLTFGFGLAIIAYPSFADRKGWPVKRWLRSGTSIVSIFGFLGVIGSPIVAAAFFSWRVALVVVVAGFFLGLVTTRTLRTHVQFVAPAGLLACWVADILYVLP